MAIKIKGIIGWDIDGQEFADRVSKLSGDVTFEIDSPGGSVFHGISIYNAIKNYDRGKCTMHVVGQASSMAGYIMMAGDGLPIFEPNAVCVLHNPWTIAMGDYKAFQKEANVLERLAELYAEVFVKKGVFKKSEIRSIMDAETWFIGSNDLKKLGTVNEENSDNDSDNSDNDSETNEADKQITIAACKERINEAKAKVRELECSGEMLDKIAALVPGNSFVKTEPKGETQKEEKPETKKEINQQVTTKEKGEKKMENLEQLKAECPKIYNEAKDEGVNAEQKRVKALMKFIDTNKEAVVDAIINGKSVNDEEFQAEILSTRINAKTLDSMKAENPDDVQPKEETHAPEQQGEGEQAPEQTPEQKADAEAKELEKVMAYMK